MITGAHYLLYSKEPEADRAFFRDILGFRSIDIGGGWLIFALPPAEMAVHPSSGNFVQQHSGEDMLGSVLYLMCDDVRSQIQSLEAKNVHCSPIEKENWGLRTSVQLPSGGHIGLYQPSHPTAI